MKPYLIDSHAHLSLTSKADLPGVIERAQKAGIKKIVNVACSLEEVGKCLPVSDAYDFIWTTAGIQPTELTENLERDLEQIYTYAKNEEKIVGIGEIGLDYYHDKFPPDLQAAFLVGQLHIARDLGLPAILHCRAGKNPGENESAFVDLIKILTKLNFKNAVVHCFSGNAVEAEKLLDMGLMLSFTGIITYPQNETMREIIKSTPLDRMMIETDSPFLPPTGYKEPCEPAYVTEVAKKIAEAKGVDISEVIRMTTANAERFFGI
ncbi:MAG: TatD family hydrolase [Candidatus Peregrinibacteria bacterium]